MEQVDVFLLTRPLESSSTNSKSSDLPKYVQHWGVVIQDDEGNKILFHANKKDGKLVAEIRPFRQKDHSQAELKLHEKNASISLDAAINFIEAFNKKEMTYSVTLSNCQTFVTELLIPLKLKPEKQPEAEKMEQVDEYLLTRPLESSSTNSKSSKKEQVDEYLLTRPLESSSTNSKSSKMEQVDVYLLTRPLESSSTNSKSSELPKCVQHWGVVIEDRKNTTLYEANEEDGKLVAENRPFSMEDHPQGELILFEKNASIPRYAAINFVKAFNKRDVIYFLPVSNCQTFVVELLIALKLKPEEDRPVLAYALSKLTSAGTATAIGGSLGLFAWFGAEIFQYVGRKVSEKFSDWFIATFGKSKNEEFAEYLKKVFFTMAGTSLAQETTKKLE